MAALALNLTEAGLAAIQAASGTDPTVVAELGLTATQFDYAPTLTALPGEFKRVEVESGIAAAPNVTHLTAYDTSGDVWSATGFGLYLADGTLFAVHSGEETIMSKAGLAFALLAFDIAFNADFAANIEFGDAIFANPPATRDMRGVARLATPAQVTAGENDDAIVTPLLLAQRLAPVADSIDAEAQTRGDADSLFALSLAALADRLNGNEFQKALTGNLALKGHLDMRIGAQTLRLNWGKTEVNGKTATTDTYDAAYAVCFGVFQGGGTPDVNSTEALRAYPGTGPQAVSHVNLTNGTANLLSIHWIAIGIAP